MGKYICKALPTKECNEDFAPDKDMQDGFEVDGFLLVGFRNGAACFESMMGISVDTLSKWLRRQSVGGNKIIAACAIAEGEIKAKRIIEGDAPEVTLTGKTLPISPEDMRRILGRDR